MKANAEAAVQSPAVDAPSPVNPTRSTIPETAWWTLIVLGFAARIALWVVSWGSNDADTWQAFGQLVARDGLMHTYRTEALFNHPPAMPYWAAGAERLAESTGLRFPLVFKLPMLAADGLTCWVLWRIGRAWSKRAGLTWAALFAVAPISILITSHHCNTEPIYVALSLLGVWLATDPRRAFWAGLALGAAVNVKLPPVLIVPVLLASCGSWGEFRRMLAGLALAAIPFAIVLSLAPRAVWGNVVGYESDLAHWGIGQFLLEASGEPSIQQPAEAALSGFRTYGKYAVLASAVLVAAAQLPRRRWDHYQAAALPMLLMLVLAPGFGVQYLLAPLALLVVAWPIGAVVYAVLSGLYALTWYLLVWDGTLPIRTIFVQIHPLPGRLFGLLAWAVLVWAIARLAMSGPSVQSTAWKDRDSGVGGRSRR